MSGHYALSYQYFQFMYITWIYLSYHCLGWYTVHIWVFVCVCCAAPDKLTSPPPFTGLGVLQKKSSASSSPNCDAFTFANKDRRATKLNSRSCLDSRLLACISA